MKPDLKRKEKERDVFKELKLRI
jgi:hypothetical protein